MNDLRHKIRLRAAARERMIAVGIDPETASGAVYVIERGAIAGLRLGDTPPRDTRPTWPDIAAWLAVWRFPQIPTVGEAQKIMAAMTD